MGDMAIGSGAALAAFGAPSTASKKGDNPAKVLDASQQFESLMVGQMMRTMREGGSGWLGTGEDAAGDVAMDFAEQQFAQAISKQGGLGLSKMIAAGLSRKPEADAPDGAAPNPSGSGSAAARAKAPLSSR
jgi:Rod binding domain-containing protein